MCKGSSHIIFVTGCEVTFFMKGLVIRETSFDRVATFMKPWRLLKSNDIDMAGFSIVKSYIDAKVGSYKNMPWEPKKSFFVLADYYSKI